jgi:hypothetical protein
MWEYLYVCDLVAVVKVGRSQNGIRRVLQHFDNAGIRADGPNGGRYWISGATTHGVAAETTLLREMQQMYGAPVYGREYFDADWTVALAMAKRIMDDKRWNW